MYTAKAVILCSLWVICNTVYWDKTQRFRSKWWSVSQMQTTGRSCLTHMALVLFKVLNQCRRALDFYENWKIWLPTRTGAAIWQRERFRQHLLLLKPHTALRCAARPSLPSLPIQPTSPIHATCTALRGMRVWNCCFRAIIKQAFKKWTHTHTHLIGMFQNFLFPQEKRRENVLSHFSQTVPGFQTL